jgi:hypothetical protein
MAVAKTLSLAAGVVQTATITTRGEGVLVTKLTGLATDVVWVRFDGTDPVAAADDSHGIVGSRYFPNRQRRQTIAIRCISSVALTVHLEAEVVNGF